MSALLRRSNRSYINQLFNVINGSCERESALQQPIMMAAFVTNSEVGNVFPTNCANKHHGYVCSN